MGAGTQIAVRGSVDRGRASQLAPLPQHESSPRSGAIVRPPREIERTPPKLGRALSHASGFPLADRGGSMQATYAWPGKSSSVGRRTRNRPPIMEAHLATTPRASSTEQTGVGGGHLGPPGRRFSVRPVAHLDQREDRRYTCCDAYARATEHHEHARNHRALLSRASQDKGFYRRWKKQGRHADFRSL